jgi:iron complex outermembrane receptor protein
MLNRLQLLILIGLLSFVGLPVLGVEVVRAEKGEDRYPLGNPLEQFPSYSSVDLLAQDNLTRVTGVEVIQTQEGLELILKTVAGSERLVPLILPEGNDLVIDILDATLAFSIRNGVEELNPAPGIRRVTVNNAEENSIQVRITGENQAPSAEVLPSRQDLILSIAPEGSIAQQPDEEIEIIATGQREEDDYTVPDANTATRTDTPIRDIPQSIQVIPRQVLEDQNTQRIQDALQNVSGVSKQGNYGGTDAGGFNLRGFTQEVTFRNGLRDNTFYSITDVANIDRIEVLKGPASVLFGQAEPGGIINIITKQPLSEPYYSVNFSAGNFDFYRPTIDLSGPLNEDKSLLYRLNLAYQNSDSFRDFNSTERILIAPTLKWEISDRTILNLDFEYLHNEFTFDRGIPSIGDRPADIPIERFLGYPSLDDYGGTHYRAGYRLEHQFSDNLSLRNAFFVSSFKEAGPSVDNNGSLIDDRFLPKAFYDGEGIRENYTLQTELVGKFSTGKISHQLLFGVDLNRITAYNNYPGVALPDIDIFNPNYNVTLPSELDPFLFISRVISLGIYLQDQVTLADNLKLLVGGRLDFSEQEDIFPLDGDTSEQSDDAFSPRIGIVYQPIGPLSLYASYSSSFLPTIGLSATNTPFEPQRGNQYEIGVKADITENLFATFAAFHLTKSNILTTDPNDPNFSIQVGEQRSQGIEFDLTGEILPGWNYIAAYAYTDAEVSEDNAIAVGNRLANVPENAASLWTTYRIQDGNWQGLGFGLGLYYVGDRNADLENTAILPNYFRTDAAIFYETERWKAGLNFTNLFDETYYETSQSRDIIYPGAPFTVLGTVSVEF